MSILRCVIDNSIDWTALLTLIVLVISLGFTAFQSYLMRQANFATAYKVAVDLLQNEETIKARRYVINSMKSKKYEKWTPKDKAMAEKVCRSYDAVGQMVYQKMLPKKYLDNWFAGLRESWKVLEPFVLMRRIEYKYPKHWDDFERLAKDVVG